MAKAVFKSGTIEIFGITYYITNLEISQGADLIAVMDTDSDGNAEYAPGPYITSQFGAEMWKDVDSPNPNINIEVDINLDFEGYQYSGRGIISSITDNAVFDTAIRTAISGNMTGLVNQST